jgi:GNAT superfamily N-acetyltransferase
MKTPDGIIIARVLPEHFDAFRIFDLYDCLDLANLPGAFVLGALDDGTYKKENAPVGVFIASIEDKTLIIEWMATDPAYRKMGIGDAFLDAAMTVAGEMGITEVEAKIRRDMGIGDEYFRYCGFDEERADKGEYRLTVSEFVVYGKLPKERDDEFIHPLSALKPDELTKVDEYLKTTQNVHFLAPGMRLGKVIDPGLSLVWMEEGKPMGALLIISEGSNHYPVAIGGNTGYEINALIRSAADRMKGRGLYDDMLIIRCSSPYGLNLARNILGREGRVPVRRLVMTV